MNNPLKTFITHSHEDKQKKSKLRTYLAVMERAGEIKLWDDDDITAGGDARQEEILKVVTDSDILVYLVSAVSLASENCNKELTRAVKAEKRVIPVILESCDWLNDRLSDFEALPAKGTPINKWNPESDGWQNVVNGIRKVVEEMQAPRISQSRTTEIVIRAKSALQYGNVLMIINQINTAIEHYLRAIELNPNSAAAYNNRGVAYGKKREYDLAIADFDTAVTLNSRCAEAYSNRGIAYGERGEFERAISDHTQAIKLKHDFAVAYNNRGNAYIKKGEFDRAITDCNTAIILNPNYAEAFYNRGTAYAKKGKVDRAIENFNKALGLKSDYARAYYNRGVAYWNKGEIDRAIENYDTAISLDPNYAETYYNRGVAYLRKMDIIGAIADFTKAIQLNPDYVEAYDNRRMAISMRHSESESKHGIDFTKAIQQNPGDPNAYYNRGEFCLRLKRWKQAVEDLNIARNMGADIIGLFRYSYANVAHFEQTYGVKLPEHIVEMLTTV